MKQHVNSFKICFYHLRRLRQIRRHAGYDVTMQLVLAVVMLCIDYCNAVLTGLQAATIEPFVHPESDSSACSSAQTSA